jgi:hypothetical protein
VTCGFLQKTRVTRKEHERKNLRRRHWPDRFSFLADSGVSESDSCVAAWDIRFCTSFGLLPDSQGYFSSAYDAPPYRCFITVRASSQYKTYYIIV